jgi:hypothetical protein
MFNIKTLAYLIKNTLLDSRHHHKPFPHQRHLQHQEPWTPRRHHGGEQDGGSTICLQALYTCMRKRAD